MEVGVLGSTVVVGADGAPATPPRKPRAILAALALTPGHTVTADRLVDLVWDGAPPPGAHGTMHAYLSTLRRVFEPDLAPRTPSTVIVTTDLGYHLGLAAERVDAVAFTEQVRSHHAVLGPMWAQLTSGPQGSWPSAEEVAAHVDGLQAALGRWRGPAYADLGDHPDVLVERAALDQQRATAQEDLQLGLLVLGEHAAVIAASEQAVAREPLRERTRCLRALALVRGGRQVEALDTLREHRRLLDEELGLEPGPEARTLEQAILRQDPALWSTAESTAAPSPPRSKVPTAPSEPRSDDDVTAGSRAGADAPAPSALPGGSWATIGREREATVVEGLLEQVAGGRPGSLLVVGEPGIGKSRLVHDAVSAAEQRGLVTAVARCSHDDGAPPLWPWYRILESIGAAAPDLGPTPDDVGDDAPLRAFAVQESLVAAVRAAARAQPLLVVFEDLHWADTRTLRALAHLVSRLEPGDRVAVLLTRRSHPQPTGALLDLGAVLARQGSGLLELTGLGPADARRLVLSLGEQAAAAPAEDWCAHTGGNPFFLVELARLGLTGGGWHGALPESVKTVVAERLQDLPDATRDALLVSAALGREHSPLLLAQVGQWTGEEILTLLEPAERIGVVRVREDGRVAFEHALGRDAVLAAAPVGHVPRVHARIAQALETAPPLDLSPAERTFELARHWAAAGPVHAASAWRAAVDAAVEARRDSANVEATALYASALASHALDPAATREERYELLLGFSEVAARAGRWRTVVEAVVEAVGLARADDDPERVAAAVAGLSRYNIWLPQSYGEVSEDLVDDLRAALTSAGPHDSTTRCRLMLSLALQLYYATGYEPEVEALADEGLALARRVGDAELRGWAARTGWLALWRPRYLDRRLALSREEVEAARECGDEAAEAVARAGLAGACVEAGDLAGWTVESEAARALARRRRIPYVEFALGLVRLSLLLMAGRFPEAEAVDARLRTMRGEVTTPADDSLDFAISFASASWRPEFTAHVAELYLQAMEANPDPFLEVGTLFQLARAGRHDDVRDALSRSMVPPVPDLWHATMEAAERADIAGRLSMPAVAEQAVEVLRAASGRMVVAGVSLSFGPVDGYLAVCLAVLGHAEEARAAAARAESLADEWGLATYREWLAGHRARVGF